MTSGRAGGTPDRYSPVTREGAINHQKHDVLPWLYCCEFGSDCDAYLKRRPPDDGSRYVNFSQKYDKILFFSRFRNPPNPCIGYGDPHFITPDGRNVIFNPEGEFILTKALDGSFEIQGTFDPKINTLF